MPRPMPLLCAVLALTTACTVIYQRVDDTSDLTSARVWPGISILLSDSMELVRNKRVGLLTNQAAVDRSGKRDIDLLRTDRRAVQANVQLVALFAPEHGLSAKEDRTNLLSTVDPQSNLPVYSLYANETMAPPDSAIEKLDVVMIDLPDVGVRTWTYEAAMVYTMRAAARLKKPVIVLDRPNPITGSVVEGPVLDSALANADDPAPGHPGLAYAFVPIPLRHGMTMAELARYYNVTLKIGADLHIVPIVGWHREVWYDRTGLPFVPPSPNLPSFRSVQLYSALVPFEATNLSVGRGTSLPFQFIGAPWLDTKQVLKLLKDAGVRGVQFTPMDVTPYQASDGKYNGTTIHGLRLTVTDRSALQTPRVVANLLVAIHHVHPTQLQMDTLRFDRLFGSTADRQALFRGDDPDAVIDREYAPAYAFRERVHRYLLY
ncbi:MAG TPA: DUF1343 domain-containing protein [Gemmatimonadaceae bacterium]|jgi:uncharacterized protein YbbC (DUF1343 family)|nr:DUF1343 domain-containing protein [Gemmatimonadaceae bacterium]